MKRIFIKIAGIIFIVIGLLALLTPFTPGSGLALIGLLLLLPHKSIWRKIVKILIEERQRDKKLKKKKSSDEHRRTFSFVFIYCLKNPIKIVKAKGKENNCFD